MIDKPIEEVKSFGDVRTLLLQTAMQIRDGGLTVAEGTAIALTVKELNSNIQCEIAAAKLSLSSAEGAHQFGRVVAMGRRIVTGNAEDAE